MDINSLAASMEQQKPRTSAGFTENDPFYDLLQPVGGGGAANRASSESGHVDFGDNVIPSYDFQNVRTSNRPASADGHRGPKVEEMSSQGRASYGSNPQPPRGHAEMMRDQQPRPVEEVPRVPTWTSQSKVVSPPQTPEVASYDSSTVAAVERTMKKYADNLMRVLEGVGGRLGQLEQTAERLERSVEDIRREVGDSRGMTEGHLRNMESMVKEVQRSIQVLRDKQEIAEAQAELAKMQLVTSVPLKPPQTPAAEEPGPPAPVSSAPPLPAPSAPPPPPASTPQALPPPYVPQQENERQMLPVPAPQHPPQEPPRGPPGPAPYNWPPPPGSAPPQAPPQQGPPLPRQQAPMPPQHQPPSQQPNPPPHQAPPMPPPQYMGQHPPPYGAPEGPPQHMPGGYPPQHPQQMPPMPPNMRYEPPPPQRYEPPPPQHQQPPMPQQQGGPMPGGRLALPAPGGHPYGPPPPHQSMYEPKAPPPPGGYNAPPVGYQAGPPPPQGGPGGYPRLQMAQPVQQAGGANHGGGERQPQLSTSRMPMEKVIDDVAAMGFSKEEVRAVVRKLTENGQSVDLNVVLDKLMNGPGAAGRGPYYQR